MRASTVTALCVGLSTLLSVGAARGQQEQEPAVDNFSGVGVRAMGMGGAFVGVADDFSAVYWNPAGLAQMSEREVYVGFQRNRHEGKSALGGQRTASELANTHFGSLGLVVPYSVYRGSLVFALGVNRVKDFDSVIRVRGFKDRDTLSVNNLYRHEGGLSTATLAAAVDVSPAISLGAAINLWNGSDERVNDFDERVTQSESEDIRWDDIRWATTDRFDYDYSGTSIIAGVFVRAPRERPRFRVGATVGVGARSGRGVTYQIDYSYFGVPKPDMRLHEYEPELVFVEGIQLPGDRQAEDRKNLIIDGEKITEVATDDDGYWFVRTDADRTITYIDRDDPATQQDESLVRVQRDERRTTGSYGLTLPIEFGIGMSFEFYPGVLVSGSAHVAEWTQSKYENLNDDRINEIFRKEYENIVRSHLGIEWQVPEYALALRAGFYSDPLPYIGPQDTEGVDPSNTHLVLIEQDRRFVTLGAGLVVDQVVQIDLAWTRGNFGQTREGGLEEGTVTRSFASLAYHF